MIPPELFLPGFFVVAALVIDFLQYVVASAVWGIFLRYKDKRVASTTEVFKAPRQINWPTLIFFWLKIALMAIAYFFLIQFLFQKLQ